jgi:hypothetical protein
MLLQGANIRITEVLVLASSVLLLSHGQKLSAVLQFNTVWLYEEHSSPANCQYRNKCPAVSRETFHKATCVNPTNFFQELVMDSNGFITNRISFDSEFCGGHVLFKMGKGGLNLKIFNIFVRLRISSSGMLRCVALLRTDVSEERQFWQESLGVTPQKTTFFIVTAVKPSNLKWTHHPLLSGNECYWEPKRVHLLLQRSRSIQVSYCVKHSYNQKSFASWVRRPNSKFQLLFEVLLQSLSIFHLVCRLNGSC